MSQMRQAEKDRHRRRADGQPPTAEMSADRPAPSVSTMADIRLQQSAGQKPPVFGQLGEVFPSIKSSPTIKWNPWRAQGAPGIG